MDILRLDSEFFVPDALIEDYTSMIWTERFASPGGFELKTPKLAETRALIPPGSLITLRDTNEVMFVETHSMSRKDDGGAELTITGRTFETFLENRIFLSAVYKTPWQVYKTYTPSEFLSLLLWNHMANASGQDPTRPAQSMDSLTRVPRLQVTDSTTTLGTPQIWTLEEGSVYKRFAEVLNLTEFGVRTIRPANTTGNVMSFDTSSTASRGDVYKVPTVGIPELRMDIYNGTDRSRHQNDVEHVIFHYESGHINQTEYLTSVKEYKNLLTYNTSVGSGDIWPADPDFDPMVSGLDRRVIFFDGGEKKDELLGVFAENLLHNGQIELRKHDLLNYFDGAISGIAPYKYNKDYFLGDYVTLIGEFGFEKTMLISEYIRTNDALGERSYPGLSRELT